MKLLDAVLEGNALDDLGQTVRAVELSPLCLSGHHEPEGHGEAALLQNIYLRRTFPFPVGFQATRTISAVPSAEKRFMSAMRI